MEVLAPMAAAMVLPVAAELPLCRLLLPPLIRLRMLPCLPIEPGAGESVMSGSLLGEAAPGPPDSTVRERGRSLATDGAFAA